jgi:hypothetical protein
MNDDQAKIARAVEILNTHRVGEIADGLLNQWFQFSSTPTVSFERHAKRHYLDESASGVLMKHQGHELVVATTKFRPSAAPDDETFYADGLIYIDGDLVVKVTATKEFDQYGSTIRFGVYAHSIRSMKVGPWPEILSACYQTLKVDQDRRAKAAQAERDRKRAADIDLGDH